MSSPNSTPQRRLLRTSNPTPPEREEKRSRRDMLDQSNDDINSINSETLQTIIPHQFKISDQDIQKIVDVVKDNIMTDITNLVLSHTQPLREEIDKLKYENRKLREDLDSVEQYGRRSLIRISRIPEPEGKVTQLIWFGKLYRTLTQITERKMLIDLIELVNYAIPFSQ